MRDFDFTQRPLPSRRLERRSILSSFAGESFGDEVSIFGRLSQNSGEYGRQYDSVSTMSSIHESSSHRLSFGDSRNELKCGPITIVARPFFPDDTRSKWMWTCQDVVPTIAARIFLRGQVVSTIKRSYDWNLIISNRRSRNRRSSSKRNRIQKFDAQHEAEEFLEVPVQSSLFHPLLSKSSGYVHISVSAGFANSCGDVQFYRSMVLVLLFFFWIFLYYIFWIDSSIRILGGKRS